MSPQEFVKSHLASRKDALQQRLARVESLRHRAAADAATGTENDRLLDCLAQTIHEDLDQVGRTIAHIDERRCDTCESVNAGTGLQAVPDTTECASCVGAKSVAS